MIASPTYLSIVAPYLSAIPDISFRYSFRIRVISSDSTRSVISLKLTISEKNTVSFLRFVGVETLLFSLNRLL